MLKSKIPTIGWIALRCPYFINVVVITCRNSKTCPCCLIEGFKPLHAVAHASECDRHELVRQGELCVHTLSIRLSTA